MNNTIKYSLSFFVFIFLTLILTIPRGLTYGASLLLVFSIFILILDFFRKKNTIDRHDVSVLFSLTAFPLVVIINMQYHHWEWSYFDNPSRFLLVIPIYFVIKKYGISLSFLYAGLALGAIGAGMLGFQQKWIEGLSRAQGYTNPIPFGDISLTLAILSSTYLIKEKNRKPKTWLVALSLLGILGGLTGFLASGTRGAWVALPCMGWVLINSMFIKKWNRYLIYISSLFFLAGVYIMVPAVNDKVDGIANHIYSYYYENEINTSTESRLEMWKAAFFVFKENFLIGIGQNQFSSGLTALIEANSISPLVGKYGHAHNEILTVLAELGFFGFVGIFSLYAGFLFYFKNAKEHSLKIATAGLVLIIGYFAFGLTQAMFRHIISTTFLAVMLAVFAGYLAHKRSNKDVVDAK